MIVDVVVSLYYQSSRVRHACAYVHKTAKEESAGNRTDSRRQGSDIFHGRICAGRRNKKASATLRESEDDRQKDRAHLLKENFFPIVCKYHGKFLAL